MNRGGERIPIGIASSVAAAYGFDWNKCFEIANQLDVNTVQLYLNQIDPEFDWGTNQSSYQQIYVHLPPEFNHSPPFINSIIKLSSIPVLIQHERYLHSEDITFFREKQLPLGFENDQDSDIHAYLTSLKQLSDIGLNLTAVVDFPRFYHQFNKKHSEDIIYNQSIEILEWCKNNQIPIIIHAIDISNYNPDHSNWVPIFSGILPWERILTFAIEESIPVKSIIFEYEDITNTEKSVYSLRQWFKKH